MSTALAIISPTEDTGLSVADEHELYKYAAANRADIDATGRELDRLRDKVHDMSSEVAAIKHLATAVHDMASEVRTLGERVERVSRRAVEKPSVITVQAFAAWAAVAVAIVAVIFAATR